MFRHVKKIYIIKNFTVEICCNHCHGNFDSISDEILKVFEKVYLKKVNLLKMLQTQFYCCCQ